MRVFLLLLLPVLSVQQHVEIQVVQKLCLGEQCGDGDEVSNENPNEEQPSFNLTEANNKLETLEREHMDLRLVLAQLKALEVIVNFAGQATGILVQSALPTGRRYRRQANNETSLPSCEDPSANITGSVDDLTLQVLTGILNELQTIATTLNPDTLLCHARSALSLSRGFVNGSLTGVSDITTLQTFANQVSNITSVLAVGSAAKKEEIQQALAAKKAEVEAQIKVIAANKVDSVEVTLPASVCRPDDLAVGHQMGNTDILSSIHYLLWTRDNEGDLEPFELVIGDCTGLAASPFNSSKPTYVIAHGWTQNGRSGWPLEAKTELLKNQDCNVITIDWGTIASSSNYFAIILYLPLVGQHAAGLLDFLHNEAGLDMTSLHMIGFSFGAQLLGLTANYIVHGPVGRITGLDPAGPEFEQVSNAGRLDSSDASFVEIIHTNGCPILSFCLGLKDPVGHVDYYVNGGEHQPGCNTAGDWEELLTDFCSHGRAFDFWIESINGGTPFRSSPCADWETFVAGGCSNCGQGCLDMGYNASTNLRGSYFLRTNAAKPFAQG